MFLIIMYWYQPVQMPESPQFTGDGVNAKVMEAATEAIRENDGCGIPTVKPWNLDTVREKMETGEEVRSICGSDGY